MKTLRTVLFYLVIFSLLSVPYSIFAYLCYLGLCGGAPASLVAKNYTAFYGYFIWVYPVITIAALILSRIFKNSNLKLSILFLVVPLLCLTPFLYVEFKAEQITGNYQDEQDAKHRVKPTDYACAPGKFIRKEYNVYYFYDYNLSGDSGSMTAYYSLKALQEAMSNSSITLSDCKNESGESL